MKSTFSNNWNKSTQPRKQRKFRANAPLHTRGKFLNSTLSKELRKKYGIRSLRVRKSDKVKVMRGNFKDHEAKVDRVSTKDEKVYLEKVEITKRDGSKTTRPFNASNLMIIELNLDDKKRIKKVKTDAKKPSESASSTKNMGTEQKSN